MNKSKAMAEAKSNTRSIGNLRALIASRRGRGGMSKVNPQIPLETLLDILNGGLAGRPDDEIPKGLAYNVYKRCDMASRDALLIKNILWECAP